MEDDHRRNDSYFSSNNNVRFYPTTGVCGVQTQVTVRNLDKTMNGQELLSLATDIAKKYSVAWSIIDSRFTEERAEVRGGGGRYSGATDKILHFVFNNQSCANTFADAVNGRKFGYRKAIATSEPRSPLLNLTPVVDSNDNWRHKEQQKKNVTSSAATGINVSTSSIWGNGAKPKKIDVSQECDDLLVGLKLSEDSVLRQLYDCMNDGGYTTQLLVGSIQDVHKYVSNEFLRAGKVQLAKIAAVMAYQSRCGVLEDRLKLYNINLSKDGLPLEYYLTWARHNPIANYKYCIVSQDQSTSTHRGEKMVEQCPWIEYRKNMTIPIDDASFEDGLAMNVLWFLSPSTNYIVPYDEFIRRISDNKNEKSESIRKHLSVFLSRAKALQPKHVHFACPLTAASVANLNEGEKLVRLLVELNIMIVLGEKQSRSVALSPTFQQARFKYIADMSISRKDGQFDHRAFMYQFRKNFSIQENSALDMYRASGELKIMRLLGVTDGRDWREYLCAASHLHCFAYMHSTNANIFENRFSNMYFVHLFHDRYMNCMKDYSLVQLADGICKGRHIDEKGVLVDQAFKLLFKIQGETGNTARLMFTGYDEFKRLPLVAFMVMTIVRISQAIENSTGGVVASLHEISFFDYETALLEFFPSLRGCLTKKGIEGELRVGGQGQNLADKPNANANVDPIFYLLSQHKFFAPRIVNETICVDAYGNDEAEICQFTVGSVDGGRKVTYEPKVVVGGGDVNVIDNDHHGDAGFDDDYEADAAVTHNNGQPQGEDFGYQTAPSSATFDNQQVEFISSVNPIGDFMSLSDVVIGRIRYRRDTTRFVCDVLTTLQSHKRSPFVMYYHRFLRDFKSSSIMSDGRCHHQYKKHAWLFDCLVYTYFKVDSIYDTCLAGFFQEIRVQKQLEDGMILERKVIALRSNFQRVWTGQTLINITNDLNKIQLEDAVHSFNLDEDEFYGRGTEKLIKPDVLSISMPPIKPFMINVGDLFMSAAAPRDNDIPELLTSGKGASLPISPSRFSYGRDEIHNYLLNSDNPNSDMDF